MSSFMVNHQYYSGLNVHMSDSMKYRPKPDAENLQGVPWSSTLPWLYRRVLH